MWHDWFYAAAAALWMAALVNLLVAGLRLVHADESRGQLKRDLSLLELAYVAGGPGRVAVTVLARMKQEGRLMLRIDGTAGVPVVTADVVDEVERAVLEVANVPGGRKLVHVAARTADSWAVRKIGNRLEAEGLVIPGSVLRHYRWAWRVVWGTTILPLPLTVYGLVVALLDDASWWPLWPVGLAMPVLGSIVFVCSDSKGGRTPPSPVSNSVRIKLRQLRSQAHRPSRKAPDALTALALTALGGVALSGLKAAQDPELLKAATAQGWDSHGAAPGGDGGVGVGGAWSGDWASAGDASGCGGSSAGCGGGGGGGCGGGCGGGL